MILFDGGSFGCLMIMRTSSDSSFIYLLVYLSIQPFHKYWLDIYYVPETVPKVSDTAVSKTDFEKKKKKKKDFNLYGAYNFVGVGGEKASQQNQIISKLPCTLNVSYLVHLIYFRK